MTKKVSVGSEVLIEAFELLNQNQQADRAVTISVKGAAAVNIIEIPADALVKAGQLAPDAVIVLQGEQAYYNLPVALVDVAKIAQEYGVPEKDILISLKIEQVTGDLSDSLLLRFKTMDCHRSDKHSISVLQ